MRPCTALTRSGRACRARSLPGKSRCRWHSTDAADVEKHREESRRGGQSVRAGPASATVAPLDTVVVVDGLNLESAAGLRTLLAGTLRQLAKLPFGLGVAHAIAQVSAAQRATVETSTIEERLVALEGAGVGRPSPGRFALVDVHPASRL